MDIRFNLIISVNTGNNGCRLIGREGLIDNSEDGVDFFPVIGISSGQVGNVVGGTLGRPGKNKGTFYLLGAPIKKQNHDGGKKLEFQTWNSYHFRHKIAKPYGKYQQRIYIRSLACMQLFLNPLHTVRVPSPQQISA